MRCRRREIGKEHEEHWGQCGANRGDSGQVWRESGLGRSTGTEKGNTKNRKYIENTN